MNPLQPYFGQKVAIHTQTKDEFNKCIKLLKELGFDKNMSQWYDCYKKETVLSLLDNYYESLSYFKEHNYQIIKFSELNQSYDIFN